MSSWGAEFELADAAFEGLCGGISGDRLGVIMAAAEVLRRLTRNKARGFAKSPPGSAKVVRTL
jgi:hypothetical protein